MNSSSTPLVSVGIPTYNQPDFLRQAIQSVLNQTVENLEIIVIDDCSTDHTPEVVREFGDTRIRYFRTAKNLRPPKSWNLAAQYALGRYFSLLPHDDLWLPNYLEKMVALAEKTPQIGFVQCNFKVINQGGIVIIKESNLPEINFLSGLKAMDWQLLQLRCNPAALLFNLVNMKAAGLWREDYWDDWALIIHIAYKYGFIYLPEPLALVRSHDANLSKILAYEDRLGAHYVLDQLFDVFSISLPNEPEVLTLYSREIRKISVSLFITSLKLVLKANFRDARLAYQASRNINPLIPFDYKIIVRILRKMLYSSDSLLK